MEILNKIRKSRLAKNSMIYIISEGIAKSIPFLLLPLLSYYLSPSDYGKITNFNVFIQILSVLVYSVFMVVLQAQYYKLEKQELKNFISTLIWTSTLITLGLLCTVICFKQLISKYLDLDYTILLIGIMNVWLCCITQTLLTIWRCEGLSVKFGIVHITQSAIDVISSVILVIYLTLSWQGRIYGTVFSNIIIGILAIFLLIKQDYLKLKFSISYFNLIIVFALPLIPHGMSFWIKSGADKILLTNLSGISSNGLYSVALTFGAIISITLTAFNNAYIPHLFKNLTIIDADRESTIDIQKNVVRTTKLLGLGIGVFCVITYFISVFFIKIIYQKSYIGAIDFLPWIILSQFFYGLYSLMVNFIHFTQKTKILGATTFSLTIAQVGLSYILIKELGPIGAPISSSIIAFLIMVTISTISIKLYRLPWQ